MIPFDLVYLRPDSVEEAIRAWSGRSDGVIYYSGGTEIVTGCRTGSYRPAVLIDLKSIPELCRVESRDNAVFFGACLSLTRAAESNLFPMLTRAIRGIADRSVRNRITLGGNLAGKLPYREALLPFLVADATAHLVFPSPGGGAERRELPVRQLHAKRLQLRPGEILAGLSVPREAAQAPYFHARFTAGASVDYPVLTLCARRAGTLLSLGVSGAQDYPVWIESAPKDVQTEAFPPRRRDHRASAEYRGALLASTLAQAKEALA